MGAWWRRWNRDRTKWGQTLNNLQGVTLRLQTRGRMRHRKFPMMPRDYEEELLSEVAWEFKNVKCMAEHLTAKEPENKHTTHPKYRPMTSSDRWRCWETVIRLANESGSIGAWKELGKLNERNGPTNKPLSKPHANAFRLLRTSFAAFWQLRDHLTTSQRNHIYR